MSTENQRHRVIGDVFANSIIRQRYRRHGGTSGFRLRCKRNRFLFMTEYRTDGRRSVSAGRLSRLYFASLSCCLPLRWPAPSFEPVVFFSRRRDTAERRKEALQEKNDENQTPFCSIFRWWSRLEIDPLNGRCGQSGELLLYFSYLIQYKFVLVKIKIKVSWVVGINGKNSFASLNVLYPLGWGSKVRIRTHMVRKLSHLDVINSLSLSVQTHV